MAVVGSLPATARRDGNRQRQSKRSIRLSSWSGRQLRLWRQLRPWCQLPPVHGHRFPTCDNALERRRLDSGGQLRQSERGGGSRRRHRGSPEAGVGVLRIRASHSTQSLGGCSSSARPAARQPAGAVTRAPGVPARRRHSCAYYRPRREETIEGTPSRSLSWTPQAG